MIDKQKLLEWLNSQIENKRLTKDMAIILGVLYGLIETGVFDCNQQWREKVHTYTTGHNENEMVVTE